jgi:hypothetical protein
MHKIKNYNIIKIRVLHKKVGEKKI